MPKYAILWLVSALLIGCASAPKQSNGMLTKHPDWVTKPPVTYGMAYGIGSMDVYDNPTEAVQRAVELARVDLVSQLKVTVSGDMRSNITETSNNQSTEMLRTIQQQVRSTIPVIELDDIKIADTWVDSAHAYALVELNRTTAAEHLRRDLADIDAELSHYAQKAKAEQASTTTLTQLQPLLPALTLFAKRDDIAARLALVSLQRRNEPLSSDLLALQHHINTLITQLEVKVDFENNDARKLSGVFMEALSKQGLRIQQTGQADLVFALSATLSSVYQNKSYYVFANSRVTISDGNGRVLNSFTKQAKGMSGMENMAEQRAAQNMAEILGDELATTLITRLR